MLNYLITEVRFDDHKAWISYEITYNNIRYPDISNNMK